MAKKTMTAKSELARYTRERIKMLRERHKADLERDIRDAKQKRATIDFLLAAGIEPERIDFDGEPIFVFKFEHIATDAEIAERLRSLTEVVGRFREPTKSLVGDWSKPFDGKDREWIWFSRVPENELFNFVEVRWMREFVESEDSPCRIETTTHTSKTLVCDANGKG